MVDDRIRQRIAKLFELGKSPNENEAFSAIQKAKQLMQVYNLSEADIKFTIDSMRIKKNLIPNWESTLIKSIADLHGVYVIREEFVDEGSLTSNWVFSGRELNILITKEMYTFCRDFILSKVKEVKGRKQKEEMKSAITWGILYKIHLMGKSASWVDGEVKDAKNYLISSLGCTLITVPGARKNVSQSAMRDGARIGAEINLSRQAGSMGQVAQISSAC